MANGSPPYSAIQVPTAQTRASARIATAIVAGREVTREPVVAGIDEVMLTGYALNAGEARILVRMRILILGGTAWVGASIARAAIARGHEVTCLARGSGVPDGAASVRADRDSGEAFAGVTSPGTPSWDAVIDVSSKPGQVRRAAEAFADRARQYVYISSCNVYASLSEAGIEETAPLNEALDADEMGSASEYGVAKVACELAVLQRFGPDRTTIIRPGLQLR